MQDFIAVLDFGSQYTHLISKRIRHIGAYTRIFSPSTNENSLSMAKGIILSGGPASVNSSKIPEFNAKLLKLNNIKHGFFNRLGGSSKGVYQSLNCGRGSKDNKKNIAKNKVLIIFHFVSEDAKWREAYVES